LVHEHRERIYIRKDIILKLAEHGQLNQSQLMSYCGLNNVKHKPILDEMVERGLITRVDEPWGAKKIIIYKASPMGQKLAREILEPYESLFPRSEGEPDKSP
jgi:predicted transcriptional regulator